MRAWLDRRGLHVIFRMGEIGGRRAVGFKIKPASRRLFSERYGYAPGFCIGPIWFGTYGERKRD